MLDLRKHIADRQDARLQCPKMATALKEQRESLGKDSPSHIYSTDYDMLNRIVLGLPAKKYKESQSFDVNLPLRDTLTAGEIEKDDLAHQQVIMKEYLMVLNARIERAKQNA